VRAPASGPGPPSPWRQRKGAAARLSGRRAEWIAALLLMAKGYRILGMRLATPQGEVDLVGLRGAVLAIVEVKRRRSSEEALLAVSGDQQERLRRAGRALAARLERNIWRCVWTWWRSRRAAGRVIFQMPGRKDERPQKG
jgi:putative endonuclease